VDCRSPKNRQERVVCATADLVDLDHQLSSRYEKLLAMSWGTRRIQLENEQVSWETSSGGCRDRVDCIGKRYTDRIAALEAMIAAAQQDAKAQTFERGRQVLDAMRKRAASNELARQKSVMSTATGRRVYDGCYAWAKRGGLIAGTQVRVFKDEATSRAAELASNPGEPFCRCVVAEIVGDNAIANAAKLEIGHQLETEDKADNQPLAVAAGVAFEKCQIKVMNEIRGK
jgi:uncharacterized protein